MSKYYCPICGSELEHGQYAFDEVSGNLCVVNCPNCTESEGMVVHDSEEAAAKYCEDNIEDFRARYDLALATEVKMSCSLEHADPRFYSEIADRLSEWSREKNDDEFTPSEIF